MRAWLCKGLGNDRLRVLIVGPCFGERMDLVTNLISPCKGPDTLVANSRYNHDGSYRVTYTLTAAGNYSVEAWPLVLHDSIFRVQLGTYLVLRSLTRKSMRQMNVLLGGNHHIEASPFLSTISASNIHPDLTWIYGRGLSYAEAGLSSNIYVQTRDEFGNNISMQGTDSITPQFFGKNNVDMQVGVRQQALEGPATALLGRSHAGPCIILHDAAEHLIS